MGIGPRRRSCLIKAGRLGGKLSTRKSAAKPVNAATFFHAGRWSRLAPHRRPVGVASACTHRSAKRHRAHVGPDRLHICQALLLRSRHICRAPAGRNRQSLGPDRILQLIIDDHAELGVFVVQNHDLSPMWRPCPRPDGRGGTLGESCWLREANRLRSTGFAAVGSNTLYINYNDL